MNWLKNPKIQLTLFGIAFGLLFPILATSLEIWISAMPFNLQSVIHVQTNNPAQWIVDLAPLVLGLSFRQGGQRGATLIELNTRLESTLQQMEEVQASLEQRVNERTRELEHSQNHSEQRAEKLEAIARITHSLGADQTLPKALRHTTEGICNQLGYDYTAIYLLDENSETATLSASNSLGKTRANDKEHRITLDNSGIIGLTIQSGSPRFAQDGGSDTVSFNNPDLPNARSEIALPLKASGHILGALHIQSVKTQAFLTEDIAPLSMLADQIGVIIENIRLLETARASLSDASASNRRYVQQEWERLAREEKLTGFQYAEGASAPLISPIDLGEIAQIVQEGNIHQSEATTSGKPAQLAVPIKLRGEVIGILNIETPQKSRWTDDDIDIAEAVAERLAFSIENARLFQTSANRATRERIVSDISSKISGNIRVETILRMAAQELSQALNGSDVLIQLQSPVQPTEVQ